MTRNNFNAKNINAEIQNVDSIANEIFLSNLVPCDKSQILER